MIENFCSIGISHWNCPLEIRELFSINTLQSKELIEECVSYGIPSAFIISTCNRTQLFSYNGNVHQLRKLFIKHTGNHAFEFEKYGLVLKGEQAIDKLFSISTGIDSQILGDLQIFFQLKEVVKQAKELNAINGIMDRLLQFVFQANKEVQSFTNISKGAASVAHASVLKIKKEMDHLNDKKVLLYGAGEIGERTLENLSNISFKELTVINRTLEKAKNIAKKNNAKYKNIEQLNSAIKSSDIIIVATGANKPTVTPKNLSNTDEKKLFIDLSVPRNIDPSVSKLENIQLVDMDMLNAEADQTLNQRKKEIPKAKTIINLHKLEFNDWLKLHRLGPYIKKLESSFEKEKSEEIEKHKGKFTSEELKKVTPLINSIIKKISSKNIAYLRDRYRYNDDILEIIKEMYNLD
jgi:glutamyl-tRNA reductase